MKIIPRVSNQIEIENKGIVLEVHCTDNEIRITRISDCEIEYPFKYPEKGLHDENTIKFYLK